MASDSRVLDLPEMKALSHPLRAQLLNELATHGPATATTLADRVGESSGSTSYHLRQLEKHGFIEEVEGRGNGRERWWRRTPATLYSGGSDGPQSPAALAAARLVASGSNDHAEQMIREFIARDERSLGPWRDAATLSTIVMRLTPAELQELTEATLELMTAFRRRRDPDADEADTGRVFVRFAAVPVLDDDTKGSR
ncbi:DNA-binding transcriptional ArsR family regulator [Curtobacterium luteum]|uniref:DNA-binding transcriptional ArsR family regulator n=1 Tax=Curtobacterium luteum TaxID=33881 RepID=A0A8H9GAP2_9MICO|nr:helix-turn-helix domain-containing protein [Curtobacterium luteum]MBM7803225.1 DNA-binding transcriptional ArsR family regulator [Curtobacterium luteum]NUU50873.1 helix-turn-helix transcriptional regulator [Curtobacterium luteum]GGK95041.1 transcriptional regulator [Curtobacterium luteum]